MLRGGQAGRRGGRQGGAPGQCLAEGRRAAGGQRRAAHQGRAPRAGARGVKHLVMWDIDYTLLRGGGVTTRAWKAAFTELTGLPWLATPSFGGRTDMDICAEVFATHGVTDCTPERFFVRYVEHIERIRHEFETDGALMPGVRGVLARLGAEPSVVQTLVTGNVPQVAAVKVAAFGLAGAFDAE